MCALLGSSGCFQTAGESTTIQSGPVTSELQILTRPLRILNAPRSRVALYTMAHLVIKGVIS